MMSIRARHTAPHAIVGLKEKRKMKVELKEVLIGIFGATSASRALRLVFEDNRPSKVRHIVRAHCNDTSHCYSCSYMNDNCYAHVVHQLIKYTEIVISFLDNLSNLIYGLRHCNKCDKKSYWRYIASSFSSFRVNFNRRKRRDWA
jgi:hypothetical protein